MHAKKSLTATALDGQYSSNSILWPLGPDSLFILSLSISCYTQLCTWACMCVQVYIWAHVGWRRRCLIEQACSLDASLYVHYPLLRTTLLSHSQMHALARQLDHLQSNSLYIWPDEALYFPKIEELWGTVAFRTSSRKQIRGAYVCIVILDELIM